MRADVVVGLERAGVRAHDDDRIVADVVGHEVAEVGQILSRSAICQTFGHSSSFSASSVLRERNASIG